MENPAGHSPAHNENQTESSDLCPSEGRKFKEMRISSLCLNCGDSLPCQEYILPRIEKLGCPSIDEKRPSNLTKVSLTVSALQGNSIWNLDTGILIQFERLRCVLPPPPQFQAVCTLSPPIKVGEQEEGSLGSSVFEYSDSVNESREV